MFIIPEDLLSAFKDGIISGQISKKIVIGCVPKTAYNGAYNENPFEQFNLWLCIKYT